MFLTFFHLLNNWAVFFDLNLSLKHTINISSHLCDFSFLIFVLILNLLIMYKSKNNLNHYIPNHLMDNSKKSIDPLSVWAVMREYDMYRQSWIKRKNIKFSLDCFSLFRFHFHSIPIVCRAPSLWLIYIRFKR